ncbi:hypothetical protein [Bacteroides pyogenes]|uniref:hypothetical protein n=1 Tax=Bacteroides pyogenes TaxID=310300 RepID=UPI003F9F0E07
MEKKSVCVRNIHKQSSLLAVVDKKLRLSILFTPVFAYLCEYEDTKYYILIDDKHDWLKQLDLRYRTNYSMSMLENLVYIKEYGETAFLQQQRKKYTCPDCGKLRTVHYDYCIYCKQDKRSGKSGTGMKKTKE